MPVISPFSFSFALALAGAFAAAPATAGDHGRGLRAPLLPEYQQECAGCHVAYPPGLLPALSWQRIMSGLPRHFGTDASVDPATHKKLDAWLAAQAGTYKRVTEPPAQDRITRSAWFGREHREVAAGTWRLPVVKSPANCMACHPGAEQGDFNEHNVRIPR